MAGSLPTPITCLGGVRVVLSNELPLREVADLSSVRVCLFRENQDEVGILEVFGVAEVTDNFRDRLIESFSFLTSASGRLAEREAYVLREAIAAAAELAKQLA